MQNIYINPYTSRDSVKIATLLFIHKSFTHIRKYLYTFAFFCSYSQSYSNRQITFPFSMEKTRKVIIVGNSGVGKTSVMFTFVEGEFREHFATIGAGERSKEMVIEGIKVNLDIWDTAGQEKYRNQLRMYMTNAAVAIVMFDVTDEESFNDVPSWVQTVREGTEPDTKIFIVGNKTDLEKTAGSYMERGDKLADELNAVAFFQCSAANGKGVNELFTAVAEAALSVSRGGDRGVDLKARRGKQMCC